MKVHGSYGFYYIEPDYVAVSHPEDTDELILLPCVICNDFYHDQVSLDKHIANDHEPFATRRPFNSKAVTFDIPNIEYAKPEVKSRPKLKWKPPNRLFHLLRHLKLVTLYTIINTDTNCIL